MPVYQESAHFKELKCYKNLLSPPETDLKGKKYHHDSTVSPA
jgi:hypothetical protein